MDEDAKQLVQRTGELGSGQFNKEYICKNFFLGRSPEEVRGLSQEDKEKINKWVCTFLLNGGYTTLKVLSPDSLDFFFGCLKEAGVSRF